MITVDQCLCFKLETGGLVIGWLTLITNSIGAIFSLLGIFGAVAADCSTLETAFNLSHDDDGCSVVKGVSIGLFLFLVVLCTIFAFFGWRCIQGTKSRDHFRIRPLMILTAIGAVLALFQILTVTPQGIVNGLITAVIYGYFFVVLYSLYDLFRREYESGANRQYQLQPGKV